MENRGRKRWLIIFILEDYNKGKEGYVFKLAKMSGSGKMLDLGLLGDVFPLWNPFLTMWGKGNLYQT